MAQPSSATVKLLKLASKVSGSEGLSHWETMHLVSGEKAMKSYMKTWNWGDRDDSYILSQKTSPLDHLHGAYGGGDPKQGKEPDLPAAELPHLVQNLVVVEHVVKKLIWKLGNAEVKYFIRASETPRVCHWTTISSEMDALFRHQGL